MLIRVMRFQGRTPDIAAEAMFTEAGGTIGRSNQCTLALADPERHISRIQAEVTWSGSQFLLVDRGSANHMQCNGEEMSPGQTVPLHDGDELHVGDYVLRVEMSQAGARTSVPTMPYDPFADLVPPPKPAPLESNHPFAPAPRSPGAIIPDDFDPFGPSSLVRGLGGNEDTARNATGQATGSEDSLDRLFGLNDQMGDPRNIGLPPGGSQPNTAASADPFDALQRRPPPSAPPISDHAPEIHSPMRLPAARPQPGGAFRSWENPESIGSRAISGKTQPNPLYPDTGLNPSTAGGAPAFVEPGASNPSPAADALQRALLGGMGLRELPQGTAAASSAKRQLDEQTMQRIGALLRLYTQGMIDLLASRAMLKSEMHAEVTMIAAQGNNPLKFSPDASAALTGLLAPHTPRGFMAAEAAVESAVNDMIAHQVGVVAGMRAALQGVLARFQPAALEGRLTSRSMLDSVLPASRKAKLWEKFESAFDEVSKEAEDDFESLFSREFVKAYEAQIRMLEARVPHNKPKR